MTGELEPPEILEPLKPFAVREGETVVLTTQIVGNPAPKVKWLKDGKPIKGLTPKQDSDVNTLTLIQPQLSDSGEYSVIATNDLGTAETRASLTVEGKFFLQIDFYKHNCFLRILSNKCKIINMSNVSNVWTVLNK